MEGQARTWFTPKQRTELWERWKSGQCVADIARALERRNKSGVYRVLAGNGGIAPALRRRALVALRLEEREEISRGIAAGRSIRRIAQSLERSPSAERSDVTAAAAPTAPARLISAPGGGPCGQSLVAWRTTQSYDGASRRSSRSSGHRSRSLAG
jgi:Helix-turn-helix domain